MEGNHIFERRRPICSRLMLQVELLAWMVCFFCVPVFAEVVGTGGYYAVLCGISDYADSAAVGDLDYCDDDVFGLRDALVSFPNWQSNNIVLLVDADASKLAIMNACSNTFLSMSSADTFLFHFSGHGTTVTDFNGDEADGLDEALCAADGLMITDDELSSLFKKCPSRKWVATIDSCYSGGMIRSFLAMGAYGEKIRGGGGGTVLDGFSTDFSSGITVRSLAVLDSGVVLTACADNETCSETDELGHGVFSYYLIEALKNGGIANVINDGVLSAEEIFSYAAPRASEYRLAQNAQIEDNYAGELALCSFRAISRISVLTVPSDIQPIDAGQRSASEQSLTNFGSVPVGQSKTIEYTISNSGESDLVLGSVVVSGDNSFSISLSPESPIPPRGNTRFRVQFSPHSSGLFLANIMIPSNDMNESHFEFFVSGNGI